MLGMGGRGVVSYMLLVLILSHVVVSAPSTPSKLKAALSGPIKHVIVLMEENRSFDHFFGWYPGVDGLTGKEYNMVNASDPNSPKVFVDKLAKFIAPCDPDHSTPATTAKIFGVPAAQQNDTSDPNMSGFVEWELLRGNILTDYCAVMSTFTPQDLPVMSALASEFVLMDRFFCAHPGPTWPNRLYALTGTSAGMTETGTWFQNRVGQLFPQPSIFDQVAAEGMVWKNYFNDTPWELMLGSLSHSPQNIQPMEQFYIDAQTGNLPHFAWINPRSGVNITLGQGSNDDHPDHDVALGEQYYKDIYEALRASPQWNETLFIITYDEHGGFYDHVPPPMNVPPPDNYPSYPDPDVQFNRLGVRIPTLLISPWVPKGLVLSEPPEEQKPASNSEYTLTSIIATVRLLLGMSSGPLTKRDAWSATFEQVLNLTEPRTDCPTHLPDAPPPSLEYSPEKEAALPVNGLQEYIMSVHANVMGEEYPSHIQTQGQVAEWAQNKFYEHADRTHKWKESKAQNRMGVKDANYSTLAVVVGADKLPGWISVAWAYNTNNSVPYITLSINKDVLCLDYDVTTMTVGVSACYPSPAPATNRDSEQHWVWGNDALVRPYDYPDLCLATTYVYNDPRVYLRSCNMDDVTQHFAWQGGMIPAIGKESGSIGWGVYSVGIVNSTSLVDL
jgi:phospholipase C